MCQEDQTSMYEIPAEKQDTTDRKMLIVRETKLFKVQGEMQKKKKKKC